MIARIILLLFAIFSAQSAWRGIGRNLAFPEAPSELSVSELQRLGRTAPLWVRITGAVPFDGTCLTTTWGDGDEHISGDQLYVPLVTEEQAQALREGLTTTVPTFVEYDSCGGQQDKRSVQGVIEETGPSDLSGAEAQKQLTLLHIKVAPDPIIIHSQGVPESLTGNVFLLLLSFLAGICALVPFIKRYNWPKERDLEGKNIEEMARLLYPLIRLYDEPSKPLEEDMRLATAPGREELVIARVNGSDNRKRPILAVFTNKRYVLYRTHAQWGLRVLGLIGRLLDKIPVVGGILSMLIEPVAETYELMFIPRDRLCREAMGYDDAELLEGRVPWKTVCNLGWGEVVERSKSVSVRKAFWSDKLVVEFLPRRISGLLRVPTDFGVEQVSVRLALERLVEILEPRLIELGCAVQGGKKIEVDLEFAGAFKRTPDGAPVVATACGHA
jgi:hypothetical protein